MGENVKSRETELDIEAQYKEIETAIANKWGFEKRKATVLGKKALYAVLANEGYNSRAKSGYMRFVARIGGNNWAFLMREYAYGKDRRPMVAAGYGTWYEPVDITATEGPRGYSEPVQLFDTHQNSRFKLGDLVAYHGPDGKDAMIAAGRVIGHAGEDRVYVQWPMFAGQEDVDDLVRVAETVGYAEIHEEQGEMATQMLARKGRDADSMADALVEDTEIEIDDEEDKLKA